MDQQPVAKSSERFDLTAAATLADGYTRSQRALSMAMTVFLTGFGLFGLALLVEARKTTLLSWIGPLVLATGGFLVAFITWRWSPRRAPRTLIVNSDGVSLMDIPKSKSAQVGWKDAHLAFYILDFRSQPRIGPTGEPRSANFALKLPGAPFAQIPDEAYELILAWSHALGLELVRREVGLRGSPTPVLRLTIRTSRAP